MANYIANCQDNTFSEMEAQSLIAETLRQKDRQQLPNLRTFKVELKTRKMAKAASLTDSKIISIIILTLKIRQAAQKLQTCFATSVKQSPSKLCLTPLAYHESPFQRRL